MGTYCVQPHDKKVTDHITLEEIQYASLGAALREAAELLGEYGRIDVLLYDWEGLKLATLHSDDYDLGVLEAREYVDRWRGVVPNIRGRVYRLLRTVNRQLRALYRSAA